jgi:murein DD-endopeptidase MepM/ murein hydrolase activator NlpD
MGRLRLALATAIVGTALVFGYAGQWPWPRLAVAPPIVVSRAFRETADTLRPGETIGALFARQGLLTLDLGRLLPTFGFDARRLRTGLIFNFRRAVDEAEPSEVTVRTGPEERVRLARTRSEWRMLREPITWLPEVVRLTGEIQTNLYDALDASVPDRVLDREERVRLAWDLADVYAWSLDFTRDVQPGDRFVVVVEREVSEEGEVRHGRVLAAFLEVGGKPLPAFRFDDGADDRFFDAEGHSLRRAFLRAPVQFRRISSSFSRSRFHPVLRTWRRHQGTDYAAAPGSPVMAAGDGMVVHAGRRGGLGIMVEIRHRNGISTRYGHLRGLAGSLRPGQHVQQGDLIGYVGSTGLSTGPHLHYEFLVNGVPQDARRIRVDPGTPVASHLRPSFEQERDRLAILLAQPSPPSRSITRHVD